MLLATELVPSSQVSTRGVPYPSPSCNIPLDQYKVIRNDSVASFEPARIPFAMAGFITVNDVQEAASRESMGSVAAGCLASCDARARTVLVDVGNDQSQEGEALIRSALAGIRSVASCLGLWASVMPRCGVLKVW